MRAPISSAALPRAAAAPPPAEPRCDRPHRFTCESAAVADRAGRRLRLHCAPKQTFGLRTGSGQNNSACILLCFCVAIDSLVYFTVCVLIITLGSIDVVFSLYSLLLYLQPYLAFRKHQCHLFITALSLLDQLIESCHFFYLQNFIRLVPSYYAIKLACIM